MVHVLFKTESHFPTNRKLILEHVERFVKGKVNRETEVSIAVVGNRKMRYLNRKYRNKDATCTVLAFPYTDTLGKGVEFVNPPDEVLRLGDIVLSYPEAVKQAAKENKLVDDIVIDLIVHGLHNLLGLYDSKDNYKQLK